MMKQMKYEATQEFERLAETISEWFAPIIRMWRFTKNNGGVPPKDETNALRQRLWNG